MASQLKNILRFAAGGPTSLPHNLNWNGHPVTPDSICADRTTGVAITADSTLVTISASANVDILVESWHTIERAFGDTSVQALTPRPFVANGGGVASDGIVFRPYSLVPSHDNVFVTWAEIMAVLAATATQGVRNLYFDFAGSPTTNPPSYSSLSWEMPNGTWDMTNVVWRDIPNNVTGFEGGNCLSFADNCHVTGLSKVDGSSLIVMNASTTNTPIKLNAACSRLHLSGFVMFCNDSLDWHQNLNAKPVIKFDDVGAFYQIYSDSPQAMLGLYGQGPQTFQDTNTPPPPILDIAGAFCFLRVQFNTKAVTSSAVGGIAIIERVSDEISCGFAIQTWEFVNAANITVVASNMTRVSYWLDNNQNPASSNPGLGVVSASQYTVAIRSGQYQPYPAVGNATYYLALHNQVIFCDPTTVGLIIELPTATIANGEVIMVKDVTGGASVGTPVTVRAKAGETIINNAAPAASIVMNTACGLKQFICNGQGQWVAI